MSALVQVSRESREQPKTQQAQMFAALLRSFTVMKLMRCLKGKQRRKAFRRTELQMRVLDRPGEIIVYEGHTNLY